MGGEEEGEGEGGKESDQTLICAREGAGEGGREPGDSSFFCFSHSHQTKTGLSGGGGGGVWTVSSIKGRNARPGVTL